MQPLQDAQSRRAAEEAAQRVNGEDEELWRHGVALAEATPVPDGGAGVFVDEHLRTSRGEQDGQLVQEAGAEVVLAEDIEEERPTNGVKSASQVQLQEDARGAELVQKARRLVHEDEIVVQAAAGDEFIMARADEVV